MALRCLFIRRNQEPNSGWEPVSAACGLRPSLSGALRWSRVQALASQSPAGQCPPGQQSGTCAAVMGMGKVGGGLGTQGAHPFT